MWGQERVVEGLDVLAALADRSQHHMEITAPSVPRLLGAIAGRLSAGVPEGVPVLIAARAGVEDLRGKEDQRGLLAEAHRGILVVDAADLTEEGSWLALREAMALGSTRRLAGEDGHLPAPEPAAISAVVVAGDGVLRKLRESAPRAEELLFRRLEFTPDVPRTRAGVAVVLARLRRRVREAGLGDVSPGALGFLVETAAGQGRRGRVALDLRAEFQAMDEARLQRPEGPLSRPTVRRAWLGIRHRRGAREESHRRRLSAGQLLVATAGAELGVVNGLMVYGQSRQSYAMPGRITARVAVGREGLINVEREAKYSGRSYDKGVYQLAGLLRALFAQTSPLGLAATLTFEQSYGRVDGDSATLAEAIAVLSCLSGVPCRQDVAVSGAINPRGEILPVGSASLKVEGWYASCQAHGLTGSQGVLMPRASIEDLQVDEDTARAIDDGQFHVWAAESVEEAVEIVLGLPAGLRPGKAPMPGSVYARAGKTMRRMSERLYPPRKPAAPKKAPAKAATKAAASSD